MLKLSYDKQRSYNYELETAKMKLLNAAEDSARIAEIKERNRIAREIHDNIGHNIAGVLMVMQAALKLMGKDDEKSKELLQRSVDTLSDGLTLLKNTVYNIKPKEELGIDYIEKVIENFSFCKVKFESTGDLTNLSPARLELVATNIKEALTNASKHSKATLVKITLSCNESFLRLQIKDNGVGCEKIKDSLGLSGMKERVKNAGGSIAINGDDGFIVVCVIPLNEKAGEIFEGFDSGR